MEEKDFILEELKLYSNKTDENSLLKQANIFGYNSIEDYAKFVKEISNISKRINEKFPTLKSLPSELVQEAFTKAKKGMQSELLYLIYPNKNGVTSVYRIDNFKLLQLRKVDCCQDVYNALQACNNIADSNYALNLFFCGLGSLGCAPYGGPWGIGGCAIGCGLAAGNSYSSQIHGCNVTAVNNGHAMNRIRQSANWPIVSIPFGLNPWS